MEEPLEGLREPTGYAGRADLLLSVRHYGGVACMLMEPFWGLENDDVCTRCSYSPRRTARSCSCRPLRTSRMVSTFKTVWPRCLCTSARLRVFVHRLLLTIIWCVTTTFVSSQAMCSGCISPHHCAYQTCHTHRSLTPTWLCTFQAYASAAYRAVLDARALSQLATNRGIGCDHAQASGAAVK